MTVTRRHCSPVLAAIAVAALPLSLMAQTPAPPTIDASRPSTTTAPLLDRELFFGNPEIAGAQISPSGEYIAFLKPYKDTRNVWVKKVDEPFSAARLVTADTKRPIPAFFWTRDSKYILYVQDNAGDENYNVYAVNPSEAPPARSDAPPARNLTAAKGARALIYSVPRTSPDTIFVGLNDRDAAWHDVYKVTISTGERTLVRTNSEKVAGWMFDEQGHLRFAARTLDNGDTEILSVDGEALTPIYTCSVFESCDPVRVHKDGRRLYMATNKGDTDLIRLVLFDPSTKQEDVVESDPLNRVDFGGAIFSDRTDELLATTYEDDRTRIYFRDKALGADYELLRAKLPGKDVDLASSSEDERLWIVSANGDTEPGETYLFDRGSKSVVLQYRIREKLPREALAPMTPVRYPSSDGLEIPAFLTLPRGASGRNLPVIVLPHGGPWARDDWGYGGIPQFLANRGYAVLQPNFRGSTGYGKKFLNAGNLQWGDRMQDDLTWGVKYLVSQGIADPKRVGIMGGSYGGYATLAGVAFTPDVYAAAVAIVAPSNLITLLETIPPYWEAARTIFHARMGDPTTPDGRRQLERQSPLNAASKITTPLLVVQGANDPRVKRAESDQIVIALRDRGFPVEYLVAPDEGHGFQRPLNNLALFAAAEAFLAKHVGGRFQESRTPEIATRLGEITVDPRTVKLADKVDAASVRVPRPAADLVPGTTRYQASIAAGGQNLSMGITQVITDAGGSWAVTETATTPMGEMTDSTMVEKGSLVVRKRSIRQGPMAIELAFSDSQATGTMEMNGQSKPIAADLGGQLFADGAGAHAAVAALPLADGYTTTFRNFDVQKQKLSFKQLTVVGSEEVAVPAGTFKAWKVQLESADGDPGTTTLWVSTDTRQVVKVSATLPQMGNAVLTSELQK